MHGTRRKPTIAVRKLGEAVHSQSIQNITNLSTTAIQATPIGSSDGQLTRSPGAATISTWDALAPGMAATISTPTSCMAWAMRMAESMTATLDSPIGSRDGPTPRRTGAARTRRKDASSTIVTAMLVLGRPPSASGVAQTSRSAVLIPLCLRTSVMRSVSSRESLLSALAASTGLAIMSSVARRMAAN